VAANKRGIAITAPGRETEDIRVGALRLNSRGLQLLSLKRAPGQPDVANFFVTEANIKSLQVALEKYEAYRGGDRPRRFNLFETVEDFRVATVADLWNDMTDKLPDESAEAEWEVWIRLDAESLFERCLERLKLEQRGKRTEFVDTAIYNIIADWTDIEILIRASAAVVELRSASSFVTEYLDFDPDERTQVLDSLMDLVASPRSDAPITMLLDTGVNYANPLVGVAIAPEDCRTIEPSWVTNDHMGHGTNMAGIALYGDLEQAINDGLPVNLTTALESIVLTAPEGAAPVPAHDAIERSVAMINIDGRARILCLAQTAPNDTDDGRQSALSGVVDRAAWNGGTDTRLICVAAGNASANVDKRFPIGPYDMRNAEYRLESPGQAVNALTVGAVTHKYYEDWEMVAGEGDLCPSSRTSQRWDVHYAYKPDIVMEGGNHVCDGDEPFFFQSPETMLLTAGHNYPSKPFGWTGETSAATARAAGLATRLQAQYPEFRAETLRGLMVHSAAWTPAMLDRFNELRKLGLSEHDARVNILSCYGWGIPDEERLFRSAGDALTLIAEDELRPYKRREKSVLLREMKYFVMPWPKEILKELNQELVELRCTLSYFAEPDPHAASRSRWDRYPSHRLRFAVKAAGDTHLEAQQRVNQYAGEEDVEDLEDQLSLGTSQASDAGWTIGDRRRRKGTIHHDIWKGRAYELAERDGISIYPVRGWWADRKNPDYHDRAVQFSLIVSIRTESTDIDLYAEALSKAKAANLVGATAVTRL
jgi:hypothetical protein